MSIKAIKYEATGYVIGYLWAGEIGSYPSRKLTALSERELIQKAIKGLNGSLDSGMGFQNLVGAVLEIKKTTTIEKDGDLYYNHKYKIKTIGKVSEEWETQLIKSIHTLWQN